MGTSLRKCSYFLPGKWYSCQGIGIPAREMGCFLGISPASNSTPRIWLTQKEKNFEFPWQKWVWNTFPRWLIVFPWHKFPKIGKFPTGKVYLSFRPFPVCKNGNRRFQSIGKKILSLGSFCAKSILGLDREIFNKMCFMQLSLKLPQGNLILLFGMKQFNIKIMPAIFRPIL